MSSGRMPVRRRRSESPHSAPGALARTESQCERRAVSGERCCTHTASGERRCTRVVHTTPSHLSLELIGHEFKIHARTAMLILPGEILQTLPAAPRRSVQQGKLLRWRSRTARDGRRATGLDTAGASGRGARCRCACSLHGASRSPASWSRARLLARSARASARSSAWPASGGSSCTMASRSRTTCRRRVGWLAPRRCVPRPRMLLALARECVRSHACPDRARVCARVYAASDAAGVKAGAFLHGDC
jgi:hypothetical protein